MSDAPVKKPIIRIIPNAPYQVIDLETLTGPDGTALQTKKLMFLCRCGLSNRPAFCDGSHIKEGIDDAKIGGGPKDKVRSWKAKNQDIIIHDNRAICSHDKSCLQKLPSVFIKGRKPWIDPDGAGIEEIIAAVNACPSGALSYSINGVHYDKQNRQPMIHVRKNGPLEVTGSIVLDDIDGAEPLSVEHYVLCRCGASKNKPFCDGSHEATGFKDNDGD